MIYDKATLVQIPSGYKAADAKLYSVLPNTADGDFTVSADADATRVNKDGLIESTSANQARLNYNFIDGVVQPDPHLLLEPTRTNLFINSNSFVSSNWFKSNATVTANQAISPTGANDASLLTATADNGLLAEFNEWTSTQRTASFFAKKNTSSVVEILNTSATTNFVRYDLESGSVLSEGGTMTGEIQDFGNGWYRVIATYSIASGTNTFGFRITNAGSVYISRAQIEEGSYPTSYIPTNGTAAAVTRTVDTCKLENFDNAPADYPFTAFVDMDVISNETGFGFSIIDISNPNIYFSVGYSEGGDTNKFRFTNRSQGTGYSFNTTSTYGTGRYKIAIKFISSTNFKAFIDGVEVADYTHSSSAFNLNINDVLLGQLRAITDTGDRNPIHQFMIFNEALSDAELITLTS